MAAPSPGQVWAERYRQALAGREHCQRVVDATHETLQVEYELGSDIFLVQGRGWQPNSRQGDREHAAAERRRIWGEVGEWLGIGPPPEDFDGEGR